MGFGPENVPKRVYCGCLSQMVILVFGIVLTRNMNKIGVISDQNTSTVTQIVDDWNELPFTKILVTDDKCPSGTDSVFKVNWGGTETGCLVNKLGTFGYSASQAVMTTSEYESYIRHGVSNGKNAHKTIENNRRREPCMPISMNTPKVQDEFYDMRFCGTRGSAPFTSAVRPKPTG